MAEAIEIQVTRSSDQKSITVTDTTTWSDINGTINDFTSVILKFYTTSTSSAIKEYTFTVEELASYIANGEVDLTFLTIFGTEYIQDNWYIVQMYANTDGFISNYDGFGTYAYLKTKVYEQVNGLHTPNLYRKSMEDLYQQHMFLKGLEYLDTSTIVSKDIKFKRRLSAITKLLA